jgi:hypothetical protein
MSAMPEQAQEVVKYDIDSYNQVVVHRSLLRRWLGSATPLSGIAPMNGD